MTVENDTLRQELLALMKPPASEIPGYSVDSLVLVRVGRMLAEASARVRILPVEEHWR